MAAENRRTKAKEMEPPVQDLTQHPCPQLLAQELLAADELSQLEDKSLLILFFEGGGGPALERGTGSVSNGPASSTNTAGEG